MLFFEYDEELKALLQQEVRQETLTQKPLIQGELQESMDLNDNELESTNQRHSVHLKDQEIQDLVNSVNFGEKFLSSDSDSE